MPILPIEDQENYNPVLQAHSPVKLANQKRYKVLKELTMQGRRINASSCPLKDKNEIQTSEFTTKELFKPLDFKDESNKTFGI